MHRSRSLCLSWILLTSLDTTSSKEKDANASKEKDANASKEKDANASKEKDANASKEKDGSIWSYGELVLIDTTKYFHAA